jgi:hypothetical protein
MGPPGQQNSRGSNCRFRPEAPSCLSGFARVQPILNATEADIDHAFIFGGTFGSFLSLEKGGDEYLQAASAELVARKDDDTSLWENSFIRKRGLPTREENAPLFVVEYHSVNPGRHFQATEVLDTDEAIALFHNYLREEAGWKDILDWCEIEFS